MLKSNKLIRYILPLLLLFAISCKDNEINKVEVKHTPAVNGETLSPLTDAEDAIRAYVGTEISVSGVNLESVSKVTIYDVECEITDKKMEMLKFKVPTLPLEQQDASHEVELKVFDKDQSAIFNLPYRVTIPVVDARISDFQPIEGPIGTEITLTGRNLEQLTRVVISGSKIEAADFVAHTENEVKFIVPSCDHSPGNYDVDIEAEWGENVIDVTETQMFTLQTPKFDPYEQAQGTEANIGDELSFTGINLQYVDSVKWADNQLLIMSQEETSMVVKFPSSIAVTDPVVTQQNIEAYYSTSRSVVVKDFALNTTPSGPAKPTFASFEVQNTIDNKFFLSKEVVVRGENMSSVEGFKINDVDLALVGDPTDVEARFVMLDKVDFQEAQMVGVQAVYGGGNLVDFGEVMLYPFFYYPDVALGTGTSKSDYYNDYSRNNAFFIPDLGEVITVDFWKSAVIDPYALSGTNTAISGAQTINKDNITKEEYYKVMPYLMLVAESSGKMAFKSPANSTSQLKTHRDSDNKSLPSTFGTPIFNFKPLLEGDIINVIESGNLTTMKEYHSASSTAVPVFGVDSKCWNVGSVIIAEYPTYELGTSKTTGIETVYKQGYIYVKEMSYTVGDNNYVTDYSTGRVVFDLYWSQPFSN